VSAATMLIPRPGSDPMSEISWVSASRPEAGLPTQAGARLRRMCIVSSPARRDAHAVWEIIVPRTRLSVQPLVRATLAGRAGSRPRCIRLTPMVGSSLSTMRVRPSFADLRLRARRPRLHLHQGDRDADPDGFDRLA
jgi:hypothetical protein